MSGLRQNDYYSRLDTCPHCNATRGNRCRDDNGRETVIAHGVRVLASSGSVRTSAATRLYVADCTSCGAEPGQPCRSGPFRTRMSGTHAARRRAVAEMEQEAP